MLQKEFIEKRNELSAEIQALSKEINRLTQEYCESCLERNGYKIGDKLKRTDRYGQELDCEIRGVEMLGGRPRVVVHPLSGKGTPSARPDLHLGFYLEEE